MANKAAKTFVNGLVYENPTFRLVLGMCPTLAVTTSATNGLGMGLAATFVLVCSNIAISLLRKFIPDKVRIPAFIVVIASFTTLVQLLLQAYIPDLYDALGLFLPLIVVNCIILARAEAFASKNTVGLAAVDGLGMGLGFSLSLTVIAMVRELLGSGSLFGLQLLGSWYSPALVMIMAPGAFITLGLLMGLLNLLSKKEG